MSRHFELLTSLGEQTRPPLQAPDFEPTSPPAPNSRIPGIAASKEEIGLVQRISLLPGTDATKSIVLCGVTDEKESTHVSARVGEILSADASRKVCLIDANVRAPSLHKRYGIPIRPGMSDAVAGNGPIQGFVHQVGKSNLWLVPTGTRAADGQMVWPLDALRSRWAEFRRRFNFIVTSAPAIDVLPDAIVFGRMSDGVILILKENVTRREEAVKVKETFDASNVRLLGAVLTHHTPPIPPIVRRLL